MSDIKEVGDLNTGSGASDDDDIMNMGDERMCLLKFNHVASRPAKKTKAAKVKVATVKKASGSGEKGDKKEKKKKDPNAPKGALSGYMFFVKEKRAEVAAQNPEMAFGEIGKELGRLWKEVVGDEKEVRSIYWLMLSIEIRNISEGR